MPSKIEYYTSFNDALQESPELIWRIERALFSRMSSAERLSVLQDLALRIAEDHQDTQLPILIQAIRKTFEEVCLEEQAVRTDIANCEQERKAKEVAPVRFRKYLAELFWKLPSSKQVGNPAYWKHNWDGTHAEQTLADTKVLIFRELLKEWVSAPTEASVYAFRRAIAMGWPQNSRSTHLRDGETNIEFNARGRYVGENEQKQYVSVVRSHLENFGSYDEKQKGADVVFGPWLSQPHVPEDIEKLLVIARAKMGGVAMARRDVGYAAVLEGIPESGIKILAQTADGMRLQLGWAETVLGATLVAQRKRYPYWRGARIPAAVSFVAANALLIDIHCCDDAEIASSMFFDAGYAIAAVKESGGFTTCTVRLDVHQGEEKLLQNYWYGQHMIT